MVCADCGEEKFSVVHLCDKELRDAWKTRDSERTIATATSHPLVKNRDMRDATLACGHALESAQHELQDAITYSAKVPSIPTREAIAEALLTVRRAREMLNITLRRIPE